MQSTSEETFTREVFYPLVDNVLASLEKRSTVLKDHRKVWGFLSNVDVAQLSGKEDLKQSCLDLERHLTDETTKVSDINGIELHHELLHVSSILDHDNKKTSKSRQKTYCVRSKPQTVQICSKTCGLR